MAISGSSLIIVIFAFKLSSSRMRGSRNIVVFILGSRLRGNDKVSSVDYFVPRNDRERVVCDVQRCHCEEWSDSGMTWQSRVDECVRSDDVYMIIRDCFVPRNDKVVWNDEVI